MKTSEIKENFLKNFWEWFKSYHETKYREQGRMLSPDFRYHQKHMKFDNYAWDWVAMYVHELNKKFSDMDELASKYSKQIELMADGMSYDESYKEVFEKKRKVGVKRK